MTTRRLTLEATGSVEFADAGADGGQATIKMRAYNGGAMRVRGWRHPVVVDVAALKMPPTVPLFRSHNAERIVGHGSPRLAGQSIEVEGVVSGDGADAQEFVRLSRNGFPWQSSIGVDVTAEPTFIADGDSANVNGATVAGPAYIVRGGELYEVSVVPLGADKTTSAVAAAGELEEMTSSNVTGAGGQAGEQRDDVEAVFDRVKLEKQRRAKIAALAQNALDAGADVETVERATRQAITAAASPEQFELALLRETRGPSVHIKATAANVDGQVLEAALMLGMGSAVRAEEHFDERTLEAAGKQFRGGVSLVELLRIAARRNGWRGESTRDVRALLKAAFAPVQAAGPSSYDIGGILGNVANKMVVDGFNAVEQTWRRVSLVRPVNDFKEVTSYSLVGDLNYEKLGKGERIKHGTLGEESYTNQADTYAKFIGIDRRDIINDDAGAFLRLRNRMGRGGALKLNEVFWTEFMDNASFFTSGRGNYDDGTDTVLSVAGLTHIWAMFETQTDPDGNPLGVLPALLLTPPALRVTGTGLCRDLEFRNTTTSTTYTTANPFAGLLEPLTSSYLQSTAITGNSSKAWYLLADPLDLPVIETVFLNGVETPTVEQVDMDADLLGIAMRGIFDFGVNKQEYRAGVKAKGEA